jgi:hypothetical protein
MLVRAHYQIVKLQQLQDAVVQHVLMVINLHLDNAIQNALLSPIAQPIVKLIVLAQLVIMVLHYQMVYAQQPAQ